MWHKFPFPLLNLHGIAERVRKCLSPKDLLTVARSRMLHFQQYSQRASCLFHGTLAGVSGVITGTDCVVWSALRTHLITEWTSPSAHSCIPQTRLPTVTLDILTGLRFWKTHGIYLSWLFLFWTVKRYLVGIEVRNTCNTIALYGLTNIIVSNWQGTPPLQIEPGHCVAYKNNIAAKLGKPFKCISKHRNMNPEIMY